MQLSLPNCPVFLAGPPGAGKSWLGRRAAERLGVPLADTDDEVEGLTGLSPAQILRGPGEKVLRRAEADAVRRLPDGFRLVALGGGALVHDTTRREVRRRGPVVGLSASTDALWHRLQESHLERPLVSSRDELEALLRGRDPTYRIADHALDAEHLDEKLIDRLAAWLGETGWTRARVGESESRVLVGANLERAAAAAVRCLSPTRPIVWIEDEGVPEARRQSYFEAIAGVGTEVVRIGVPGGEATKTWTLLGDSLERAAAAGGGRQSVVVGLGGGATTDLAGMVAGLLGRGAPLVTIPSTLLAQVDAAVGGKCAVNLETGKNLAGLFHPARDVLVDRSLLDSLPADEWRAGLAETFKMALLAGEPLFSNLLAHPEVGVRDLTAAIRAKADVVASDPFEEGPRRCLNLGHTLGHALERASGYRLRHGDAVAKGIAAMTRWSENRGLLDPSIGSRIRAAQQALGLPGLPGRSEIEPALFHIAADKKGNRSEGTVVGLTDIGEPALIRIEWDQLRMELASLED